MVSINNSKDLIANSLQLVQEDGELKDIKEVIATAAAIIEGDLTPEQIQTISNLSSALNNDPNFFSNNQAQINSKAAINNVYTKSETDGKISDLINDAPEALNTLNKLASALGDDENFATTITGQIATKAPLASPTFTGTVSGVTKSMVGLGNVDNTSDLNKPISTAIQAALNLKSDKLTTYTKTESDAQFSLKTETQTALDLKANQATTYTKSEVDTKFTDIIDSAPDALNTLSELANALANDSNYATTIANQLATKAPQATTYTKTETDTLLNAKEDVLTAGEPANGFPILSGKGIRGLVATAPLNLTNDGSTSLTVGLDTSNLASKAEVDGLVNLINTKANLTQIFEKITNGNDTFLQLNSNFRFVASNGVLKLQRYDNDGAIITDSWVDVCSFNFNTEQNTSTLSIRNIESDTNQINIKDNVIVTGNFSANGDTSIIAGNLNVYGNETIGGNLTVTGTVSGVTKTMVGLGNVDNTGDIDKPISTATQTALNLKAPINNPSFTSNCTVAGSLFVNGTDLTLGALAASRGDSGLSRALVKDNGSTLTINYNGDFTGGTRVMGPELAVDGDLVVDGVNVMSLLDLKAYQATTYTKDEVDSRLSDKQDTLLFAIPTGGQGLSADANTIKGLKATAPITVTGESNAITLGLDKVTLANDFEVAFDVVAPLEKVNNILSGNIELRLNPEGDIEANEVLVDSLRARTANQITINDNVTITGNLTVNGTNNIGGGGSATNPFWVAGRVKGSDLSILQSNGQHSFTVTRATAFPAGVYKINFAQPHPDGSNYIVIVHSQSSNSYLTPPIAEDPNAPQTSSYVWVTLRNTNASALIDETFHFAVLAPSPTSIGSSLSPYWCSGVIQNNVATTSTGRYGYTVTNIVNGHWQVTFNTPHPSATPTVLVSPVIPAANVYLSEHPTSTGFKIYPRTYQWGITTLECSFIVLA